MNMPFNLAGAVALVTGANRGIGRAYADRLARSGVRRVYAGARDPNSLRSLSERFPVVVRIELDVTDAASVKIAADRARDVNLLINNAGIAIGGGITDRDSLEGARAEMEVNYFGLIEASRAFAPALVANAPSALVNVLSIASLISSPLLGTYGATKAAALSATRTIRAELSPKGVLVVGVMPGFVDTEMAAEIDAEKITPDEVVDATLTALQSGIEDVFPGTVAAKLASLYFPDHEALEQQLI